MLLQVFGNQLKWLPLWAPCDLARAPQSWREQGIQDTLDTP